MSIQKSFVPVNMNFLETDRLQLLPLGFEDCRLFFEHRQELEKKLGLTVTNVALTGDEVMDVEARDDYPRLVERFEKNQDRPEWFTFWQVVLKNENRIIGSFCFGASPDERGEIMLGYVVEPTYQNKGYMTETIRTVVRWAFEQQGVRGIHATVPANNGPSHRVLEKNGFKKTKEVNGIWWWKKEKE